MKSSKLQWSAALLVAAIAQWRHPIAGLKKAGSALQLWFGGMDKGKRVNTVIYSIRLATCKKCPIFYHKLATCGTPFGGNSDLGCFCYMPAKAKLKAATCWLDDNTDKDIGWKRALKQSKRRRK